MRQNATYGSHLELSIFARMAKRTIKGELCLSDLKVVLLIFPPLSQLFSREWFTLLATRTRVQLL